MVVSVPNQDYIDSIIQSIHQQSLNHDRLCQLLFTVIDQFCVRLPVQKKRGRKLTYPDSTILKLDMLMHLTGKRGETEILREIDRHYAAYFAKCPKQPRLWIESSAWKWTRGSGATVRFSNPSTVKRRDRRSERCLIWG